MEIINPNKYNQLNFILEKNIGKRALVKCPSCNSENYAFNVLEGICAWCNFDINQELKND